MKVKRKLSKKKIFIFISILIVFSLITTYMIRFIYYYRLEHKKVENNIDESKLYAHIIEDNKIIKTGDGLYNENNKYIFKGKVKNNYIYYSNRLWRIIDIEKDNTIKLITNDIVSSLVMNYENNDYSNSYIRKWLNKTEENTGIFYDSLNNPDKYIETKYFCSNSISSKDYSKCKTKLKDQIGLLTYSEYEKAKSYDSYLNINKYFWLINPDKKDGHFYVFNEGGVNSESHSGNVYYSYGIRPVVYLKNSINFISGKGTENNPYIIEDKNSINSGSYVKYSNYIWKVVSKNKTSIKLIMNENLKINEEEIKKQFSLTDSTYNPNNYYNIGYYLNRVFYYNLTNKNIILESTWYTGSYDYESNYDYKNVYTDNITAKVGLLNVTDLYETNLETLTLTKETDDTIYTIKEDGSLFVDSITSEFQIRPVINIDVNTSITSGTGKIDDPYIIEE